MLKCLETQGYAVEWRVINAAEYGYPQRRRRVFILGYHKSTSQFKRINKAPLDWIKEEGIIASAFPIINFENEKQLSLKELSVHNISNNFNSGKSKSPFENTGLMLKGNVFSFSSKPYYFGKFSVLSDVLEKKKVEDEFYIDEETEEKWEILKDAKRLKRKTKEGHEYMFSEGKMSFPDPIDKASRTIITGEGGKSPSRFKHVVETRFGKRRLTPIELERLNGFPDNHTKLDGITNSKRAFFMGNALVCGVIKKIGESF